MDEKLYDLVSRIDERVKFLVDSYQDAEERLDDLSERLAIVELEVRQNTNKWKVLIDNVWKVAVSAITAYIAYKLGNG